MDTMTNLPYISMFEYFWNSSFENLVDTSGDNIPSNNSISLCWTILWVVKDRASQDSVNSNFPSSSSFVKPSLCLASHAEILTS